MTTQIHIGKKSAARPASQISRQAPMTDPLQNLTQSFETPELTPGRLMQLQRTIGNRAVSQMIARQTTPARPAITPINRGSVLQLERFNLVPPSESTPGHMSKEKLRTYLDNTLYPQIHEARNVTAHLEVGLDWVQLDEWMDTLENAWGNLPAATPILLTGMSNMSVGNELLLFQTYIPLNNIKNALNTSLQAQQTVETEVVDEGTSKEGMDEGTAGEIAAKYGWRSENKDKFSCTDTSHTPKGGLYSGKLPSQSGNYYFGADKDGHVGYSLKIWKNSGKSMVLEYIGNVPVKQDGSLTLGDIVPRTLKAKQQAKKKDKK